ncbi:MAG: hypothetical protein LBF16_04770 [Pseudomonadales bacterium]|jgi:hypothetical protein|nr:hypothetical protein [Pseudomonadales bacterium]
MPTVKGSKQHKMIVVPYRPVLLGGVAIACVLVLIAGSLGYFGGRAASNSSVNSLAANDLSAQVRNLARDPQQLAALLSENAALEQQLVRAQQSSEVDKQALASVQETLADQRDAIAQLQEDVLFYKQITDPQNAKAEQGLVIGRFDLMATTNPRRLRYKIEFRQQGSTDKLSGHANVNVLGDQDGQRVSLPLSRLSKSEKNLDIPLSFRYFQNLEGELELPEGFTPTRVQVLATSAGNKAKSVQKSFAWVVRN